MTLTCQESSWLYNCLPIQFLIIWPSGCSFEVRILSPFYRWRNRGLRRWNNLVKVILQVSGRDRPPVRDARVQIHLTVKAHNYFWLAVLILALVVPSAGWMTSNRPLSFGGFMSEIPAGSACVCYACPWTIKMRVFGSFRSFQRKAAVTLPPLGNSSWLPKAELLLILFPQHSQPCTVIYLQIPTGGRQQTHMNRK